MCNTCGHGNGTTKHLLYWQSEWLKRFMLTWWHIVNRKAYWKWYHHKYQRPNPIINKWTNEVNEGLRMDLDEILKD